MSLNIPNVEAHDLNIFLSRAATMGSLPIEPEDFDLNTQKLLEQQRRVLEAQQKVRSSLQ